MSMKMIEVRCRLQLCN